MSPTEKSPKVSARFVCDICNYRCCKPSEYNKHLSTAKHKILQNPTYGDNNMNTYSCPCGKTYKHSSTLYAHKKKCKLNSNVDAEENVIISTTTEISEKDLIMLIVKQNTELIKENNEFKNMMMKVIENGTHNTTNNTTNSHNKAFNLNFFLNETCKDAMNIMDFVDSIKLQLSDLEKVGELGYVEGISNIIVKNLNELDVTLRPVHCTDKKRETMYIRDENKWEKDESNSKIKKAIKRVASKNQRLLPKFKEAHPDCGTYHSKYSDQYNKIIIESVGGSGDNDAEKEEKIIRNITRATTIEK
jgi:hypothetical protein